MTDISGVSGIGNAQPIQTGTSPQKVIPKKVTWGAREVIIIPAEKNIPPQTSFKASKPLHKCSIKKQQPTINLKPQKPPKALTKKQNGVVFSHLKDKGYSDNEAKKMAKEIVKQAKGSNEIVAKLALQKPVSEQAQKKDRRLALQILSGKGYGLSVRSTVTEQQKAYGSDRAGFLKWADSQPSARLSRQLKLLSLPQPSNSKKPASD